MSWLLCIAFNSFDMKRLGVTVVILSVCNFSTAKLFFRRNNRIWRKGLFSKTSSVVSNQTRQCKPRILRKCCSVPPDFSWIENYKQLQGILITSSSAFTTSNILRNGSDSKNLPIWFFWTNVIRCCQKKSYSVENTTYYLQHLNSVFFIYYWIQSFRWYLTKFDI